MNSDKPCNNGCTASISNCGNIGESASANEDTRQHLQIQTHPIPQVLKGEDEEEGGTKFEKRN
jgi:hypothetical protein